MADGYERLPEWFWHPTHGLYGHEEPARPGDRTLYVRVDDAAGSPPPTPAPTREHVAEVVRRALIEDAGMPAEWFPTEGAFVANAITDAVLALLSTQPAPPLWAGRTMAATHRNSTNTADVTIPGASVVPPLARLPVPPGTAVEVREKRP